MRKRGWMCVALSAVLCVALSAPLAARDSSREHYGKFKKLQRITVIR